MKIVSMFMIVKVPDDFEGTFDDVIRIIDQQPPGDLAPTQPAPVDNAKIGVHMRDIAVMLWPSFNQALHRGCILTCSCAGQKWNGTDWEKFIIGAPSDVTAAPQSQPSEPSTPHTPPSQQPAQSS